MPPGTVATAPMLTNPTTSSVRPGMMMKSGHPFWVRSTPDITTSSAKTPTTTSTMPRAALEPARRGFAGYGTAFTYGGGAAAAASGANVGPASVVSVRRGDVGTI